jgi:uncharacterized protein
MRANQSHRSTKDWLPAKAIQKCYDEPETEFEAHPWLRNPHLMTFLAEYWPRNLSSLPPATERLFLVDAETQLLAKCHWQSVPRECSTLVLVHGLEGSSESRYILGTAAKAFAAGLNVVRVNQRNCGGTEHLTPTLYNSGLSGDYRAILKELIQKDRLPEIFFAGYSMGGNLVVKMAGEFAAHPPRQLRGICAVCPSLDLAGMAEASDKFTNLLYQWYFLWCFRRRMRKKARLFPNFSHTRMWRLWTMQAWDQAITAPCCGYDGADDYYFRASALRVMGQIHVPTFILAAQDDPIIPIASFHNSRVVSNRFIKLETPKHGGHCGFVSKHSGEGRFWAEKRVVEFCLRESTISEDRRSKSRSQAEQSEVGGRDAGMKVPCFEGSDEIENRGSCSEVVNSEIAPT